MSDYSYLTGEGTPSLPELGTEVAASFVPGLNVAQALRDYKKAAKENKYVDMGLSALGLVPGVGAASHAMLLLPAMLRKEKLLARNAETLATHTTTVNDVFKDKLLPDLYNPSLAVQPKTMFEPFGGSSKNLLLVNKPGAFDPRNSNTALYSHDVLTPNAEHGIGAPKLLEEGGYQNKPVSQELAQGRLADKLSFNSTPDTAGFKPRMFGSFKEYLASPKGQRAVKYSSDDPEIGNLYAKYGAMFDKLGLDPQAGAYKLITSEDPVERAAGIKLARSWDTSSYGELKAFGPVQLNSNSFSGALVAPGAESLGLIKALRNRGIPLEQADFTKLDEMFDKANWLQQLSIGK